MKSVCFVGATITFSGFAGIPFSFCDLSEIASRSSSSVAPLCLAPARSRFAQWVLPAARLAAR